MTKLCVADCELPMIVPTGARELCLVRVALDDAVREIRRPLSVRVK
jgi:hypothetical protein